jgi:hypothetical protein
VSATEEKIPGSLVREAVDTATGFFPRLTQALTIIARDLREDRLEEGLALFNTTGDGLKWFCNMVELRGVWMGSGPAGAVVEKDWPSFIDALAGTAQALGDRDYVLLSDLLSYEIIPFIGTVLAALQGLREEPSRHAV